MGNTRVTNEPKNGKGVSDKPESVPEQFSDEFLSSMDGRCKAARELRDRLDNLYRDLGGESALSYQLRRLAMRAIWLEAIVEGRELKISQGQVDALPQYIQSVNSLIGLYKALDLQRKAKKVPSLSDYLDGKGEQVA